MNPEDTNDQAAKDFLMDFAERKKLLSSPDEIIQKLGPDRWIDTWKNKVVGMPRMDVGSPERYPAYMG